jgi:tetratricopeptide (TPR) repeat protein
MRRLDATLQQMEPSSWLRIWSLVLFVFLGGYAAPSAPAQQAMAHDSTHNMSDMEVIPPPEQLPVPVRMNGIGNSHITIKATPEAQAWFDQGLSLLHDFWEYESQKAFEQAIRVDPHCAMCWWGLAQAEGTRHSDAEEYGKKALAEAVRLKSHGSASDKLYIEAAQAESNAKDDDRAAATAIYRKLVKKYPHDTQARIFLAESLCNGYDEAGEPKPGQKECISILEGVLKDAPSDSAANHYWIHAIEPGNHPERALTSAALLASLAPTSGHMVHMPGHIYFRLGNYPEAEHWFSASTQADEKYMREQHVSPDDDWNYVHNMMYAIANLMEQGRLNDANALSDHLAGARGKLSNSLYIWSARDQMARVSLRLPVALRVGDWDAVLTLLGQVTMGGDKTVNLRALAAELTDYAKGMKALEQGDLTAAQAASDHMDAGLWRVQQRQKEEAAAKAKAKEAEKGKPDAEKEKPPMMPVMPDALSEPIMKSLSIESLELRAGILAGKGKLDEAKKLYEDAASEEKKLGYHEPPMYIRPVGETEAAALVKAKDFAGAKAAYEASLKERPNSGFGLYGLARVKELSGDMAGAREAYQAFLKAWPAADSGLPEVAHARKVIGGESVAVR